MPETRLRVTCPQPWLPERQGKESFGPRSCRPAWTAWGNLLRKNKIDVSQKRAGSQGTFPKATDKTVKLSRPGKCVYYSRLKNPGKMSWRLRALAALAKDSGSIPSYDSQLSGTPLVGDPVPSLPSVGTRYVVHTHICRLKKMHIDVCISHR